MDRTFSIILMGLSALIFSDGFAMADAQTTYNVSPGPLPFDESDDPVTPDSAFQFIDDISTHPDFIRMTTANEFKNTRPAEVGEFEAVGKPFLKVNGRSYPAGTATLINPGFKSRRWAIMSAHSFFDNGALIAPLKNYYINFNKDPLGNNMIDPESNSNLFKAHINKIVCLTDKPDEFPDRDICLVNLIEEAPDRIKPVNLIRNPIVADLKGELYSVAYPASYGFGRVRAVTENCGVRSTNLKGGLVSNCDCGPGCSGGLIYNSNGDALLAFKGSVAGEKNGMVYPNYLNFVIKLDGLNSRDTVVINADSDAQF